MASTLKINTLTGVTTAGSIAVTGEGNSTTTNLQQGLCKAFITIDVSAGAAFSSNDSFNIGSVTDGGTGIMNIVFTNNMVTVRHSAPAGAYSTNGHAVGTAAEATTGTSVRPCDNGGSASDTDCYIVIHGTMA